MNKIRKKNNPVRQHHVPKVYLRYFCNSDGSLTVYDKRKRTLFSTGLTAVGVEKDFYTLDEMEDPYCWERTYANGIEPMMGKVLSKVISKASLLTQNGTIIIDDVEKTQLSIIMIMQLLRGKQSRDYENKLYQFLLPDVVEKAKATFGPLTDKQLESIQAFGSNDYYFKRISMDVSLDTDRIVQYAQLLGYREFIVYRIHGNLEFVTSDNPVMFINSLTSNARPFSNGLLQESTLVYYPISPKLLICAVHPDAFFQTFSNKDGSLFHLNADTEKRFIFTMNRKQMEQCHSQVYARSENTLVNLN